MDREGRTEVLTEGRQFRDVRLSPDGRRALVTSPTGANFDIWLLDIEREARLVAVVHREVPEPRVHQQLLAPPERDGERPAS